jgi:hypothetical protein
MSDALIYKTPDFTIDELRSAIGYDPDTGVFTRKAAYGRAKAGAVLGTKMRTGYLSVCFKGQNFKAHRLAWFYVHGVMPSSPIDHVNGDRKDNRIENLRLATNSQNCMNKRKRIDSSSPYKNVTWNKEQSKWNVKIQGKHIGSFVDGEFADLVACMAREKYHGAFARSM